MCRRFFFTDTGVRGRVRRERLVWDGDGFVIAVGDHRCAPVGRRRLAAGAAGATGRPRGSRRWTVRLGRGVPSGGCGCCRGFLLTAGDGSVPVWVSVRGMGRGRRGGSGPGRAGIDRTGLDARDAACWWAAACSVAQPVWACWSSASRVGVAGDRRVVGEPLDLLVGGSDAVLRVLDPFGELGELAGGAGVGDGQVRALLEVGRGSGGRPPPPRGNGHEPAGRRLAGRPRRGGRRRRAGGRARRGRR